MLAADYQEDVTTDQDVAELKVQCPADKAPKISLRALKQDQAATLEEHSGKASTELLEEPLKEQSEKSSKEPLQKPSEKTSEEPEHLLGAAPAPAIAPNLIERLDKEDLESVSPKGDIHFSAKENKEDSQRLQEKREKEEDNQEKKEKQREEKEVQEDAQPMENLLPAIPTTRDDVQYEDQRPALKEFTEETPAEGFGSQGSQLELQNQDCNSPFELLGEELLTSFVVVDSNSQDRMSGAGEFPDCSPTSDHMKVPSPASPAPPLDECQHFTALEPETLASFESEDQTSWTEEPPESTADQLVLVSDIPKTSSEVFDLRPAMAGNCGLEEEQEKEEVTVKDAPAEREPCPEMFLSVQVPEVHGQEEELLLDSTHKEMELHPDSTLEEELHPDSIQEVELLHVSTQKDEPSPNFIQKEEELLHDDAKVVKELPPNSAQEESPTFSRKEMLFLSNSSVEEEPLSKSAQKIQLHFDSSQKEELLPDSDQGEKLPPNPAQEMEELCHDAAQEKMLLNSTKKEVKLFPTSTQEQKLLSGLGQKEELPYDSTQKVKELPTDSAQKVQLFFDLAQREVLLPHSNQEAKLPADAAQGEELFHGAVQEKKLPLNSVERVQLLPNSTQEEDVSSDFAQKEELLHDLSQKKQPLHDSTQEEEPSPDSTQDDITTPVITVSWWSSGGRDPAPGDWILIPEHLATTNEDTFGHQVESEYQRLMDQFAAQVEASLKVAVEVIEREEGEVEEEEEVEEKKSRGAREEEEERLEKKDEEGKKKGGEEEEQMGKKKKAVEEEEEEQERRRTEISIMEATMDANEWVTDLGQQLLPWLGMSIQELAEESSALGASGGPAPRVAAIPPLMPQTVEVTFRLHYLTWSEQQTLAITGSRPELGGWAAFIPLEREVEGKEEEGEGEGRGFWSGRVRLPAHSQLEWKFVVLDMGRVSRWEECRNRVLDTGDRDQLVHGWWGRE